MKALTATLVIAISAVACKKNNDSTSPPPPRVIENIFKSTTWSGYYQYNSAPAGASYQDIPFPYSLTFGGDSTVALDNIDGSFTGDYQLKDSGRTVQINLLPGPMVFEASLNAADTFDRFEKITGEDISFLGGSPNANGEKPLTGTAWAGILGPENISLSILFPNATELTFISGQNTTTDTYDRNKNIIRFHGSSQDVPASQFIVIGTDVLYVATKPDDPSLKSKNSGYLLRTQ